MIPPSLALALLLAGLAQAPSSTEPTAQWLTPFVGVWNTEDTYHPAGGGKPSVERAVRTCEMVMRGSYLQCESVVTRPDGTGRTYRFLLSFNRILKRFEMLSLWSNVPFKLVQSLAPDAERRRWRIENVALIGDVEPMLNHWSELVFESPDRITWTGRRVAPGTDPVTAPIGFVETWIRAR